MPTTFIRWANRAQFEIRNGVIDDTTDDVEILDYATAEPDSIYYVRNNFNYERSRIAETDFNRKQIDLTIYTLTDDQVQTLIDTGTAIADGDYRVSSIKVYLASEAAKLLDQIGNESLAKCYARLVEARNKYKRRQSLQRALLAASNGYSPKHTAVDTLATDIKTFLENRDKCLAALKPKQKAKRTK